jgi:protein involved in polysaccharide export with SLBB domain
MAISISLNIAYAQDSMQAATPALAQQSSSPFQQAPILNNTTDQQKACAINGLSPDQQEACVINGWSPDQQKAVQAELNKYGGTLTPEAIEALKKSPEFKNLKPEEIIKGKELLEKNNKTKVRIEPEKEKKESNAEQRKILGEDVSDSLFTRSRHVGKYQDIKLELKPFGYDFFHDAAIRVVTDSKDVPVPSKYVVGPGDEVKIMLWGRVNAQYNLTIDRNGSITIPQIGPLYVAGMTFQEMSVYLIKQSNQIVGANIDVTMGALKTIPVFILGDVKRPGAYMIGSFATITDALLLAGGPTDIGSMRNVQLKRKDKVVTNFDLYDLLLKGNKGADAVLQAGDVVFVPVCGPLVGVAGNVKRPAIYELKDKFELQNLFDLAGGIIPTAYTQQIQIERIVKNEKQIIVDIDDKHLDKSKLFQLQDADLIKVFSIVDANLNVVYLNGHVKRPGKYELKPGMKLKDIIKTPEDLRLEAHFEYGLIKRIITPGGETTLIPFNLGKLIFSNDAEANLTLMPQDNIFIFSDWFFKDRPSFSIAGEVRMPEKYDWIKNFKVKDAILAAGGLTKDAYLEKAEILRVNKNRQYQTIYFNVSKAMLENEQDNILLQDEDKITIHSVTELAYKKTVSIEGDVLRPGTFQFTENMTVKELVFAAGNILESAYLDDAEIASMEIENGNATRIVQRNINLRKALEGDEAHNVKLRPYDRVFVKRILDWRSEHFVTVTGQFKFPGRYIIRKGEKLSSLIQRAGGYTDNAYLRGAVFIRERVKEMQQKGIEEMALRLEKDLLAQGSEQVSSALSNEEIQGKQYEITQKKKLIENMRNLKALGRMTIKLDNLHLLKGREYDIELENGDSLFIPEKNSVVTVTGSVMAQGSYVFSEKDDYLDYINMSGGYSDYADESNIFILKVDGSARKARRSLISWKRTFSDEETSYIEPGDVIVVPEKIERIAWLREVRDITQILMNTAVVAGVVKMLF